MASLAARAATGVSAPRASRVQQARPSLSVSRVALRKVAAPRLSNGVATQSAVEIAQLAGEAGFIAGTAFTMVGITLVGLALGFVLLRVEALAEEGKL